MSLYATNLVTEVGYKIKSMSLDVSSKGNAYWKILIGNACISSFVCFPSLLFLAIKRLIISLHEINTAYSLENENLFHNVFDLKANVN